MAILGIDEVGRGPWAGPLVVGVCVLPQPYPDWCDQLTDSKKLSARKRQELNQLILAKATTATGWVSSQELDKIGLSSALKLATRRAIQQISPQSFDEVIIDGTINFLADTEFAKIVTTLKKADLLIKEVSAASIVAKVARDQYMINLTRKYPNYGFENHVGYGTAAHKKALELYGPCLEHRFSFRPIKILSPKPKAISPSSSTALGSRAENVVKEYLELSGHQIIAQNYKTKFYEIDLISSKGNQIFFTEVKYRKNSTHGVPLEFITPTKHQQMQFAAECFLKFIRQNEALKPFAKFQPVLAAASVSGTNFQLENWLVLD